MDLSVSSVPNQQQVSNNAAQAGNVAPQTEPQRQDYTVQRVTTSDQSSHIEDNARDSETRRFQTLKSVAASYIAGKNPFLNDVKFTVYNRANNAQIGNFEIRFTDLSTGVVEVKSEAALLGAGNIVSGQV